MRAAWNLYLLFSLAAITEGPLQLDKWHFMKR